MNALQTFCFYDAFQRMKLPSHRLQLIIVPLVEFIENSIQVDEAITLLVTIVKRPCQATKILTFLIVWVPLAYNAFQVVVSTYLLLMKFSTSNGIDKVHVDQMMA